MVSFNNSLSFLNCNIRSLQANFDNLVNMLSELHFPISVLSVTETKLKNDQEALLNIVISGYNFLSQPSCTYAGGVGFYVKDNVAYTHRPDLSAKSKMIMNPYGLKFIIVRDVIPFVGLFIDTPMVMKMLFLTILI